jgi:hypothetical protein
MTLEENAAIFTPARSATNAETAGALLAVLSRKARCALRESVNDGKELARFRTETL